MPRRPAITAFVGRLDIDTTEEDLTKYLTLTSDGMKGVVCKKLKAKDGGSVQDSAFSVTCSPESQDLFYNESCWLEGAEPRDWIFLP